MELIRRTSAEIPDDVQRAIVVLAILLLAASANGHAQQSDIRIRAARVVDGTGQVLPDATTKPQLTVSPFVSYRRKLGRMTWTGQVNVNNIFNKYKVDLRPSATTGFSRED